ncbi:hypothetical protein DLJ96_12820, partial [Actinotalea fermentans ATCC 43279 = JCM 9966 = DSM 3133]
MRHGRRHRAAGRTCAHRRRGGCCTVTAGPDDAPQTDPAVRTSPLLSRPGAVAGSGPDAGVAWHYGDPTGEQRALGSGGAVVDLSHHGVVRVTGPDRLTWLHSITSQDLLGLAPRTATALLVLSPQG